MTLGLVVLIGVPALMLLIGPILSPLQRRSAHQRHLMGDLSNTASDIVSGLRVLRGIGGEQVFHDRYRRESQTTRRAGVDVARLQSVLDALQVFLPGVFVVLVVWLGARSAVAGQITGGELVAFYGYVRVPDDPAADRDRVRQQADPGAGGRAADLSRADADPGPHRPRARWRRRRRSGSDLVDVRTGLHVRAGLLTAVVADQPDESAALADRLGLCAAVVDDDVRLGGVPLSALARAEVRERIVVSDTGATFFSGRLGDRLDVRGRGGLEQALDTASADDIFDAIDDGLDTIVAERGRTFSGGQRQRLVLARALTSDPEILVLVEPTSAVDAHTEARIAVPAAGPPGRPDHRGHLEQPAGARRGGRGGVPARRARGRRRARTRTCSTATRRTGPW